MFFREENPALFDCLVEHIKKFSENTIETAQFDKIRVMDYDFDTAIPNEILDEINYLFIDAKFGDNISSLNGIGKLKNLDTLIITTIDEVSIDWRLYSNEKLQNKQFGETLIESFNRNQIKDISPLYECKKLDTLQFYGQRQIEEVDLGAWPDLKMLDMSGCTNLRVIKGLDKLKAFENLAKSSDLYEFNFIDCARIERVEGFREVAKKCLHTPTNQKILLLPVLSYFHMINKDSKTMREYLVDYQSRGKNDFVLWGENEVGAEGCLVEYDAQSLIKMHKQIRAIVNSVCDDQMSALQQIKAVYDWVTKNVVYDCKGLDYSKGQKIQPIMTILDFCEHLLGDDYQKAQQMYHNIKGKIKQTKLVNNAVVNNFTQRYHKARDDFDAFKKKDEFFVKIAEEKKARQMCKAADIRSSYNALFKKKAICVGISNLYNNFLAYMGYKSKPCYCKVGECGGTYWGDFNHQITQCDLNLSDGRVCTYYFDPTLDLGVEAQQYFCLNKEEIEYDHDLGMSNFTKENAPSLQGLLDKKSVNNEMERGA